MPDPVLGAEEKSEPKGKHPCLLGAYRPVGDLDNKHDK